jgi:hypothetical protein
MDDVSRNSVPGGGWLIVGFAWVLKTTWVVIPRIGTYTSPATTVLFAKGYIYATVVLNFLYVLYFLPTSPLTCIGFCAVLPKLIIQQRIVFAFPPCRVFRLKVSRSLAAALGSFFDPAPRA